MKVIDIINKTNKTLFTFELLPPIRGQKINSIYNTIDTLAEYDPAYINITYHREEVVYEKNSKGQLIERRLRRRPGTVGIAAAIQNKYNIPAVPHLICAGFSKYDTEAALIELNFLGIDNLLVLRGDPLKSETVFTPHPEGHRYASELVKHLQQMNKGCFLGSQEPDCEPTNFSVGVAGYPEKHGEAANIDDDLKHLKEKVDAGADYIVTQLFFNNEKYFDFLKRCRKAGITVPIIPGLKPISMSKHLELLPKIFDTEIPQELSKAIRECKTNDQVRQVGVEWAIQQSKELKASGVPVIHFYTMGRPDNVAQIAKEIF